MTQSRATRGCRWCGRAFAVSTGRGRPQLFCCQACRQRDYVSRLRSHDAGLSEAELIVTRTELDALRDKLYVLECAVADVRRDLHDGGDPAEALEWLIQAAEPLTGSADLG